MKISQMITALTNIMEQEGDLRVTIFNDYGASEGWGYKREDLWLDGVPSVDAVLNDEYEAIETVVTIGAH